MVARLQCTLPMSKLASHWWMFAVRGMASLALAVLLLLGPGWSSSSMLTLAFGVYVLVDGASSVGFVLGARGVQRLTYVGRGLLGIGVGALTLAHPPESSVALYALFGVWGIGAGALELLFGSRTWSLMRTALPLMIEGVVAIGFGLTLIVFPLESVVTLRAFLVAFALMNGAAALAIGEELHQVVPALRHA